MENMEFYEMEDMRQQINLLKSKLEKQAIVNDVVLRKAMSSHLDNISRRMRVLTIVGIMTMIYAPYVFYKIIGTSMEFTIFTTIMLVVAVAMQFYSLKILPRSEDMNQDILSFDMKIMKFCRVKNIRTIVGLAVAMVFILWLLLEIPEGAHQHMFIISVSIGFGIGLIIGGIQYRLIIKHANNIHDNIKQIRELQDDPKKR